jgi:phosphosulfolactate synthase
MHSILDLPKRPEKPRGHGMTVISDRGLGLRTLEDLLDTAGAYVDYAKLSVGTAYVTPRLKEKVLLYRRYGIECYFGGTLFEVFAVQGKFDDYCAFLSDHDVRVIEVSNGLLQISDEDRCRYVEQAVGDFVVFSEVGSKDTDNIKAPYEWVAMIRDTFAAGAEYVILEGRESGDAGIYRGNNEARLGLLNEVVHEIDGSKLIFEAPKPTQQAMLIREMGSNVNLGNVMANDVIHLEAQRLGLKYETLPAALQ